MSVDFFVTILKRIPRICSVLYFIFYSAIIVLFLVAFKKTTTTQSYPILSFPITKTSSLYDVRGSPLTHTHSLHANEQSDLYAGVSPTFRAPTYIVNSNNDSNSDSIKQYKQEAMKIRLEAEKLELELIIQKTETIQNGITKLRRMYQQQQSENGSASNDNSYKNNNYNRTRLSKRSINIGSSIEQLEQQIRILQNKVKAIKATTRHPSSDISLSKKTSTEGEGAYDNDSASRLFATVTTIDKNGAPSVVAIDRTSDRIVVSSNSSTLMKSDTVKAIASTTGSTSRIPTAKTPSAISFSIDTCNAVSDVASTMQYDSVTSSKKSIQNTFGMRNRKIDMIYGFDKDDLDLYLPVAHDIDRAMVNATIDEKLEAFRSTPTLQQNFKDKLRQLLVEPIKDMNLLDALRADYLDSTSIKEKELLKRQIDRLTNAIENDGPFMFSDSVYRQTEVLSNDEIYQRVMDIETLPQILQIIYKQRYNLSFDANITLAILLDHYEIQLQLIEQIKSLPQPLTTDVRNDIVEAIESLPIMVLHHVMTVTGLDPNLTTIDELILELSKNTDDDVDDNHNWWDQIFSNLPTSVKAAPTLTTSKKSLSTMDWTVLDSLSTIDDDITDIEMIDRSRYVYDLYPSIAQMENDMELISLDAVEHISRTIFDLKKSFMITNKVERVVGGYYIRGRNVIDEDESGVLLLKQVEAKILTVMRNNTGSFDYDSFEYFYIRDPAPITDEELELEYRNDPVFVITRKNQKRFYNDVAPFTKVIITVLAFVTMGLFTIDTLHLGDGILDLPQLSFQGLAKPHFLSPISNVDDSLIFSSIGQVVIPMIFIQLLHEIGHRIVAWKDKFSVGIPTFVPSMEIGCFGSITPLSSPPPNLKSMFDFAIAGPMLGFIASFALLVDGLQLTSTLDLLQLSTLPSLPTYIIRSSTLGSAFIEWFLGASCLIPDGVSSFIPLHPFAIAGYVGMLSNALALLPLGKTDGGRIAIAMFGRRGTILVKTLTAAFLCAAGLFGLDDSGLLLNYVIIILLWQNEIESPARNEVEELDFGRGAVGIISAILVLTILLPMRP